MNDLHLSIACGDYDRTRRLITGEVRPRGIELDWASPPIEVTIAKMLREEAYDVAEMSLSAATIAVDRGLPELVALPVFPSRFFRHSAVFVNSDSGLTSLAQLPGRRVGMFKYYRMAAAIWFRGILRSDYGIEPSEIEWFVAESSSPGQDDRIGVEPLSDVSIHSIGDDADLDQMLESGEIDALLAIRMPRPYREGSSRVRRLLQDPLSVELDYYRRTRIFPIMHTLVVRRAVFEENPWIGESLCNAFEEARILAEFANYDIGEAHHSLAWFVLHLERERQLLGSDIWAYGVEPNERTLSVFLRYCHEQGLTSHWLQTSELFSDCAWNPP